MPAAISAATTEPAAPTPDEALEQFISSLDTEEATFVRNTLSPDAADQLAALPAAEWIGFLEENVAVDETVELTVPVEETTPAGSFDVAAASRCYTARADYEAEGVAGNTIYKHWHVGGWCTNSAGNVSSASTRDQGGSVHWVGWHFRGKINGGARVIQGEGRSYTQHKFELAILDRGVIQQVTPCLRVRGFKTGNATVSRACGLY